MGRPLREHQFIRICEKIDSKILSGKISFKNQDKVFISVDNSIVLENKIILIEIDASNMAKLVMGQYVLLNILQDFPMKKYKDLLTGKELIFFVIHCYGSKERGNKFNPDRSKNNMKSICSLGIINPIKYGAVHIDDFLEESISTRERLLEIINQNICSHS